MFLFLLLSPQDVVLVATFDIAVVSERAPKQTETQVQQPYDRKRNCRSHKRRKQAVWQALALAPRQAHALRRVAVVGTVRHRAVAPAPPMVARARAVEALALAGAVVGAARARAGAHGHRRGGGRRYDDRPHQQDQ